MPKSNPKTKGLMFLITSLALVFIIAACSSEPAAPVEIIKEVIKEVVVEKEVVKEVQVPGETVVVEKEIVKEVQVAGETVVVEKEVIKEVQVAGETVIVEKIVVKEVQVAGETVIVEKIVIATPVPTEALVAPSGQKYGGTIKLGVMDFGTMDPALMGLSEGSAYYSELTYDNGTVMWFDGDITPWALEAWASNDTLTQYTFKVREGNRFHHGKEMKAEDIKFTFDRVLNPETASPLQGQLDFIDSITEVDDYTVTFDLKGANAFLPALMTIYHAKILPSDIDISEITSKEFGSGAFTLGEHNPAERTVLEADTNYWRQGYPFVDQVIMYYMPESTSRVEAIKSGAIDALFAPSFGALDQLADNPNVVIKEAASAGVRVVDFHTNTAPYDNKDLRKAFQYAIDRDFVREAGLFGRGSNANDHPVGINDEYYWDEQPITKQDIPRAKAYLESYLAAAGLPAGSGFDAELHTSEFNQHLQIALALKESVAAAGINITITKHDAPTYWEEIWMNPCCPLVSSNWGARPANEALAVQLKGGGVWNESYYSNARFDELLELASGEPDLAKRKEYFREIQEILIEDVPVLYLMHPPVILAHRSRLSDVKAHPGLSETFIENWWISQ